jgi:putative transposase
MIVGENQAVYVEDLCVAGLSRTRLAKSVHDAGWSAFVAMLEYKAARYGRAFARIGRFEPTSQVCPACGVKDGPKPLSVRTWTCAACGTVHDRDVNAARNVLALGRRESLNACRGGVRPGKGQCWVGHCGAPAGREPVTGAAAGVRARQYEDQPPRPRARPAACRPRRSSGRASRSSCAASVPCWPSPHP